MDDIRIQESATTSTSASHRNSPHPETRWPSPSAVEAEHRRANKQKTINASDKLRKRSILARWFSEKWLGVQRTEAYFPIRPNVIKEDTEPNIRESNTGATSVPLQPTPDLAPTVKRSMERDKQVLMDVTDFYKTRSRKWSYSI